MHCGSNVAWHYSTMCRCGTNQNVGRQNRRPQWRNALLPIGVRHKTSGDVMTKVDEYRARASECEPRAREGHDLEVRQQLLELARQWHHMAAQSAHLFAHHRPMFAPILC